MTQEITLLRQYCSTCKAITYHIRVRHQGYVCLQCWPAGQDPPPPLSSSEKLDPLILFWQDTLATHRLLMSPSVVYLVEQTITKLKELSAISSAEPAIPISSN